MNKGKMIGGIAAMLLIGAAFFSALGALVNWRVGTPLAVVEAQSPISNDPVEILQQGVLQSLTIAHDQLVQRHRTQAVIALDSAKRAADVGRHGTSGNTAMAFDEVYRETEHARARLQDGNPRRAEELLRIMSEVLNAASPTVAVATKPENAGAYAGAHVINAQGVRIGEVENVRNGIATLRIGGNNDVLGFIDLGGGKLVSVPVERLVFGKRKGLGSTMVALPTFAVSPATIYARFSNQPTFGIR